MMDVGPAVNLGPQEQVPQEQQPDIILSRDQVLSDLLQFCNEFIRRSSEWRRNSFETQWQRWQRNSDAIYDPDIASKKEAWQSKAFVPLTPSHRENAQAQLFKTEVGPRPPLEVKARPGILMPGQPDQSENIRDLILRERERSKYEVNRNTVVEEKTTFGSAFARMRFETKVEDRVTMVPQYEPVSVFDPSSILRAISGQRQVVGYAPQIDQKITYRGVRFEPISIWDVFPDPKALKVKGFAHAIRYYLTLGEIVEGVKQGYYIQECLPILRDHNTEDTAPLDKKKVESDRAIADSQLTRTDYQKNLICYILYARLPKKWVFINGEPIDDPEALIPAIIRFHQDSIIGVEVNDETYDGEAPLYKDDYMPVAGQYYGRGIPEMLKDAQLVGNESVNQRLDAGSIVLDPQFAVMEKAIVDPKDLDGSRAGGVVRIKSPTGSPISDVRAAFMRIDKGTIDRASIIEPQEWERYAHQRTSVTETSLGTEDNRDTTLGAQQIEQGVTGTKMAFIGMLSEFGFQYDVTRAYWELIYKNYNPEDYAMALGPQRAASVIPMSPEQVENAYQYYPLGVYEMENKNRRQAQVAAWVQQFGMQPWANVLGAAKEELRMMDVDQNLLIIPEAEGVQIVAKAQQMAQGMAQQMVAQHEQQELAKKADKGAKMEKE